MREDQALELVKQGTAIQWQGPGIQIPLSLACLENRKQEKPIAAFARAITHNGPIKRE